MDLLVTATEAHSGAPSAFHPQATAAERYACSRLLPWSAHMPLYFSNLGDEERGTTSRVHTPSLKPAWMAAVRRQGNAKGHVAFEWVTGPNIRNVSGEASLKCTTC